MAPIPAIAKKYQYHGRHHRYTIARAMFNLVAFTVGALWIGI